MAIEVACVCGKRYAVTDDKAGKKLRCQQCQNIVDIPQKGGGGIMSPPMAVPPSIPPPVEIRSVMWYYAKNGQPVGPISEQDLTAKLMYGEVSPADLAWKAGDANSAPMHTLHPFNRYNPGAGGLPAPATAPKKKKAAILLVVLLGWAGAHRFYLGHTGMGLGLIGTSILSVISGGMLGFIGGIWIIVDFVLIITGSMKDASGRPMV